MMASFFIFHVVFDLPLEENLFPQKIGDAFVAVAVAVAVVVAVVSSRSTSTSTSTNCSRLMEDHTITQPCHTRVSLLILISTSSNVNSVQNANIIFAHSLSHRVSFSLSFFLSVSRFLSFSLSREISLG
jgi:hypothetical protein